METVLWGDVEAVPDYASIEQPDLERDVARMVSRDWWWLTLTAGVVIMAAVVIGLAINGSLAPK
jgi:hypothetical protein